MICEKFKIGNEKQTYELKREIERLSDEISRLDRERKQQHEIAGFADSFKRDEKLISALIDRLIERIEISHDREINIIFARTERRAEYDERYHSTLHKALP